MSFARLYCQVRNLLLDHLPADEVRLLLWIDRAALFHRCPREWDYFPESFLSDALGIRPDDQRRILANLQERGVIEVITIDGQRAIKANGERIQELLGA